jgi:Leucine-rich repeat (LRR) protein
MKLVATKAFGKDVVAGMTAADIAEAVMNLERVVLDDECIEEIDNLEPLGAIKQLHLQRNRLESICNLESLQHLQLLSLASNDIMDLRNLTCLCTLKALDVGYNLLDEVGHLPPPLPAFSSGTFPCSCI